MGVSKQVNLLAQLGSLVRSNLSPLNRVKRIWWQARETERNLSFSLSKKRLRGFSGPRKGIPILLTIVALIAAACSSSSPAKSTTAKRALTPLVIAVEPGTDYHLFDYVAQYAGFFAKNGLNVTIVQANGAAASAQFALGGRVNIFTASPSVAVGAAAANQPLKLFAIPYTGALPGDAIMGASGIKWPPASASVKTKLEALRGKVVGVQGIGAGVYNSLVGYLKLEGIPVSSVTIVNIAGYTAAVPALEAHRIDAYFEYTVLGKVLEETQAHATVVWNLATQPFPGVPIAPAYGATATESWLKKNPVAAAEYLKAIDEATVYCEQHPNAAATIFNKEALGNSEPASVVQKVVRTYDDSALFKNLPAEMGAAPTVLRTQVGYELQSNPKPLGTGSSAVNKVIYILPASARKILGG